MATGVGTSARNSFRSNGTTARKKSAAEPEKSGWDWPRIKKISGIVLMAASFFLLLSFISHLFDSRAEDMSVVQDPLYKLSANAHPGVSKNFMGVFGAWAAQLFIDLSFGLSSFLFIPFIFIWGYKLLFELKNIKLNRYFYHALFFVFFFSIA